MKTRTIPRTATAVLQVIEEAREAELCRDIDLSAQILESIWPHFDNEPDFSLFPDTVQAELYRLCGAFLSFYGKCRNRTDYQMRAKDMLTRSARLFDYNNLPEMVGEAKIFLALAYWHSGEVEECEALLELVEREFSSAPATPIFLRTKINQLMVLFWKGESERALEIIERIAPDIERCNNTHLVVMFHNLSGVICRVSGKAVNSIPHYNEAIKIARRSGNVRFEALNQNCLAMAYKDVKNFDLANEMAAASLRTFRRLGDEGWCAHVLDTQAQIYLACGAAAEALASARNSIRIFETGEDHAGFCDSLWTECRCHFRLGNLTDGIDCFQKLLSLASSRIGPAAKQKYIDELSKEIYPIKGKDFQTEVSGFKKTLVRRALVSSGGAIVEASRKLGLNSHQSLSEILSSQFPELYEELGIKRRTRARRKKPKAIKPSHILRLPLDNCRLGFEFEFEAHEVRTFFFSMELMERFGVEGDCVVAVSLPKVLAAGMLIIYYYEGTYEIGTLKQDPLSELFYIMIKTDAVLLGDDLKPIGCPVGYCPFEKIESGILEFKKLDNGI